MTIVTFAELVFLAVSRVSSGKPPTHFREAKSIRKWFAESISLHIMLTDSSLALEWMFVLHSCVLRLPCSGRVVAGIRGCPDLEHISMIDSALRSQISFFEFPSISCRISKFFLSLDQRRPNNLV